MEAYILYNEFRDAPHDIYPVRKQFTREYDELEINWAEIDFNQTLQEIGNQLYFKYNKC